MAMNRTPQYSIGAAARSAGLTPLVLRAWERRYGVVRPSRTQTGRRMYTQEDVDRLSLLKRLTDAGHRIGGIANLSPEDLGVLAAQSALLEEVQQRVGDRSREGAPNYLEEALKATADLDASGLEDVLQRASLDLSPVRLRRELIQPLMVEIGELWRVGTLRIAHEHLATAVVRTFLSGMNTRQHVSPGSPLLVITTPSGDLHEIGALLAASHALEVGYEVLYLGPNMPADEIAASVNASHARAIYLSLVYPLGDHGVRSQLLALRRLVGEELPILVGGRAVESYQEAVAAGNMLPVSSPEEFDRLLASLPGF